MQQVKIATKTFTCVTNRLITYVCKSFTLLHVYVLLDFHPVGHACEEAVGQAVVIIYVIVRARYALGLGRLKEKKNHYLITVGFLHGRTRVDVHTF